MLLRGSRWPSGRTWNSVVINIRWVWLPSCHWPKVGLGAAKWLIKNNLKKTFQFFSVFVVVFDKQANVRCSIGSISRPTSSCDHNPADETIVMNSYPNYFEKHYIFFSRKQQGATRTDRKIYSLLIYHICMVVTIFKVATSQYNTFIRSWTSMLWREATYLEILLPSPNNGRSISQNLASLNILVHDLINLLYYEHWTYKWKIFLRIAASYSISSTSRSSLS